MATHTRDPDEACMSLRSLNLPLLLNTSDQDLFRGFFVPALTYTFRYDRGVGYFASGWLRLAAQGMVTLATEHAWRIWSNNRRGVT